MSEKIKYMGIKEFREKGYLQEINRRFLHPLGLALEVFIDEDDNETLKGIWDYREDKAGIHYALSVERDEARISRFREKKIFIDAEIKARRGKRESGIGYWVEPIPDSKVGE